MAFVDKEITDRFVESFELHPGCVFVGRAKLESVTWMMDWLTRDYLRWRIELI